MNKREKKRRSNQNKQADMCKLPEFEIKCMTNILMMVNSSLFEVKALQLGSYEDFVLKLNDFLACNNTTVKLYLISMYVRIQRGR